MKRSPPSSEPQSPASASHPDEQLPDGPKVFSDLYSWPQNFLLRLDSQFPEESKLALNNLRDRTNVVLTTSFSGMGTPEIAVKMISSVLQKNQIWCKDKTFVYASCDLDSNSQKVLMHHAGRSGSKHIFADVCGTVFPETVNHLKDFLKPLREEYISTMSKDQPALRPNLERKFHVFAQELFQHVSFNQKVFCIKCGKFCQRWWSDDDGGVPKDRRDHIVIEVGGSPCIPFVKGGLMVPYHDHACFTTSVHKEYIF